MRSANRKEGSHHSPKRQRGDKRNYKQRLWRALSKFEGNKEELKRHVYILGYVQGETLKRTTTKIAIFVGRIYKNGADVKRTVDGLTRITITVPTDLPTATTVIVVIVADPLAVPPWPAILVVPAVPTTTATERRIWECEVDNYVRSEKTLDGSL